MKNVIFSTLRSLRNRSIWALESADSRSDVQTDMRASYFTRKEWF